MGEIGLRGSGGEGKAGGAHIAHNCEACGRMGSTRHKLCRTCRRRQDEAEPQAEWLHRRYHEGKSRLGTYCGCCAEHHPPGSEDDLPLWRKES